MALTQNDRDLMVKIADLDRRLQIQERNENQIWKGANFPTTGLYDRRKFTITTATRDEDFFYDLANTRWLSTTEYNMTLAFLPGTVRPITIATVAVLFGAGPESNPAYSILVTTLAHFWFIQATFNATNFWTGQLYSQDATNPKVALGPSFSSWATGRLASVKYLDPININTVLTQPNLLQMQLDYTLSGAPGNFFWDPCILKYRLVG
jgi:hypothetical protein